MSKGLLVYFFAGFVTIVIWLVGTIVIIKTEYYYATIPIIVIGPVVGFLLAWGLAEYWEVFSWWSKQKGKIFNENVGDLRSSKCGYELQQLWLQFEPCPNCGDKPPNDLCDL